jgi:mRNA-degrading endonuclease toxin of MazEF toxin-antitoxin module
MTTSSSSQKNPMRGELWWVNFDPSVGSEQQKTRPAVVASVPSVGKLPLRIVVPVTDWKPQYSTAEAQRQTARALSAERDSNRETELRHEYRLVMSDC